MTDQSRSALPIDPETDRIWRPVDRAVLLAVFIGGALGGLARYLVQNAFPLELRDFPWTTLLINCTGAFALAFLLLRWGAGARSRLLRPLVGTGFLGGWTTFSSVVVTADQQLAHDHAGLGLSYLVATAVGGILSAFCGGALGSRTC